MSEVIMEQSELMAHKRELYDISDNWNYRAEKLHSQRLYKDSDECSQMSVYYEYKAHKLMMGDKRVNLNLTYRELTRRTSV